MFRAYWQKKNKQHQEKPKVDYHEYLDHPSEPRDDLIYGIVPSYDVAILYDTKSMKQRLRYLVKRKRIDKNN